MSGSNTSPNYWAKPFPDSPVRLVGSLRRRGRARTTTARAMAATAKRPQRGSHYRLASLVTECAEAGRIGSTRSAVTSKAARSRIVAAKLRTTEGAHYHGNATALGLRRGVPLSRLLRARNNHKRSRSKWLIWMRRVRQMKAPPNRVHNHAAGRPPIGGGARLRRPSDFRKIVG